MCKVTNSFFISVTPSKLSHLSDTTIQASHTVHHPYFGSTQASFAVDGNRNSVLYVGYGQSRWVRLSFARLYEVEYIVISAYNDYSDMYFEIGNSTTAGENLLCGTQKAERKSFDWRYLICSNQRMIGNYAIFHGNGEYFIREFEVYGWENVRNI